jgi:Papain family cysteine protease
VKRRGYIRDPEGVSRLVGAAHHVLGTGPIPTEGLVPGMPPVMDQGSTSSCVGHSIAANLTAATGVRVAPLSVYTLARCVARDKSSVSLADAGTYPWAAAQAVARWGVASLDAWPSDFGHINAEPDLEHFEACDKLAAFSPRKLAGFGAELAEDVARAISLGHAVSFGISVTQEFEDLASARVIDALPGMVLGGHFVCAYAYETDATGRLVFRVRNSWGASWGADGDCLMSEAFVGGSIYDPYVFEVTR